MAAAPRLHHPDGLAAGATVGLQGPRAHYLAHVLRLRAGAAVRLFNAEEGEWAATLAGLGRQQATLVVGDRLRAPEPEPGPVLHFVPIRRSRLDWVVEKAVELGASALVPVLTERAVARLENPARLRAIIVEAAEQCGRLSVPELHEPVAFGAWLAARDPARALLVADEAGGLPLAATLRATAAPGLLVGPEGGLAPRERSLLRASANVHPVTLGRRVLRSETAALALLAVWQAICAGEAGES